MFEKERCYLPVNCSDVAVCSEALLGPWDICQQASEALKFSSSPRSDRTAGCSVVLPS